MEMKIEKQKFYISEFEQEAAWLSFMQKEGWKFISTDGWKYKFEKCDKEEWIYQLDFKENGIADEDYIQMFQDYGWEYVFQFGEWFYFRKKKESDKEDLSIFSDRESKVELCKRIIKGQFLRTLPGYFLLLVYEYLIFFTDLLKAEGFFGGLLNGIAIASAIILLFLVYYHVNQFSRLHRIIKNNNE